jgi:hypothetical protein
MPDNPREDSPHEHTTQESNGYTITFHPAFSSGSRVRMQDGSEIELHRQNGVHRLTPGQTRPPTEHEIRLRGGPNNRDIVMQIRDPRHHIARIIVELYAEDHEPGWGKDDPIVETLDMKNAGVICPPDCG